MHHRHPAIALGSEDKKDEITEVPIRLQLKRIEIASVGRMTAHDGIMIDWSSSIV